MGPRNELPLTGLIWLQLLSGAQPASRATSQPPGGRSAPPWQGPSFTLSGIDIHSEYRPRFLPTLLLPTTPPIAVSHASLLTQRLILQQRVVAKGQC